MVSNNTNCILIAFAKFHRITNFRYAETIQLIQCLLIDSLLDFLKWEYAHAAVQIK